jgi:hypothetical protein
MNTSNYQANTDNLLVALSKKPYGYGVLVGKQLEDFYLICIDIDIDTEECKERISKEFEELLSKNGIKYYKEMTKSNRIHYYIALDKITEKMKIYGKLNYEGTCIKYKDGKEVVGEIELFTKSKSVVVYDGFINDNKPFFIDKPIVNDYRNFDKFLDEYNSKFYIIIEKAEKKETKEPKKEEPKKEPANKNYSELFSKIVEAYKIIRKYRVCTGWDIDRVFSAYCVRENIKTEQAVEGFKVIFGTDYKEKMTMDILNRTNKKKKNSEPLPEIGSVFHYIRLALNIVANLEAYEKAVLEAVLNDLKDNYSDYELPEYLENVEDVILDYSIKMTNKDGKVYYKEGYFIEQRDREVKEIKKVIYVNIISFEKSGIYKFHSSDGKIKEVGIKADIIRLIRDGDIEDYEYLLNDKVIFRPPANASTIEEVVQKISRAVSKYSYSFDNNFYKKYLTLKIRKYIKENGEPIPCVFAKNTGWSEDLRFFYHYALNDKYHELSKEHTLYKKGKAIIKDKDNQHAFVKALLREGKLLGVLLVASVSSLFIKPFNTAGITVILGGNSGAGKTTSSLIATSLFYYSDDVLLNAQTTKTGLELTISSLNSLPVLVDEGALAGFNLSLNDLVFMISSGTGKTRGRKDLSVDFKELKSNVFWTTETTDIDELRRTGAFRRMLYLVIKSWNDLTGILEIENRINEQYSGCGIDYIQYLIEHMEDVRKAFKEETKDFSTKYREITTIALNLYSGLILLEKFYGTKFNHLRKTIDKVLDDAKMLFIENKENVEEKLKEFLNKYLHIHFHVIHPDGRIERAKQEAWGEYDLKEAVFYIRNDSWSEIVRKLEKERKLITKELKDAGLLTYKDYRHKASNEKIKTYIIKFKVDENDEVNF